MRKKVTEFPSFKVLTLIDRICNGITGEEHREAREGKRRAECNDPA